MEKFKSDSLPQFLIGYHLNAEGREQTRKHCFEIGMGHWRQEWKPISPFPGTSRSYWSAGIDVIPCRIATGIFKRARGWRQTLVLPILFDTMWLSACMRFPGNRAKD